MRKTSLALAFCLTMIFCAQDVLPFVKRKDKSTVLEVPTSGKIIEVNYRAEFDEWWVHCREGDTIVVYTYDYRNKTWGKIAFVPKKPDDKSAGQAAGLQVESEPPQVKPKEQPELKAEKKEPEKTPRKAGKWWDPLNFVK